MRRSLVLVAFLLLAAPAEAHRLKVFATVDGDNVQGTAYFAGGGTAANVPGRVLGADGGAMAAFRTDPEGAFRVSVGRTHVHAVVVDGGDGHVATLTLGGEEANAAPAAVAPELAAAVEQAVARQVRPLREQLDAYEAKTRLHDLLGGIGIIIGVFGVFAWIRARPETGHGP
ncbi:MAG: hypothetical protein HY985_03745 [Magnetospirillum sp.]|nr:hypothetical protein [Magnetospirillum sp.]